MQLQLSQSNVQIKNPWLEIKTYGLQAKCLVFHASLCKQTSLTYNSLSFRSLEQYELIIARRKAVDLCQFQSQVSIR